MFQKLKKAINFFNFLDLLEPHIIIPSREYRKSLKKNDPICLPLIKINKIGDKYINNVRLRDLGLKAQSTIITNNGETILVIYIPLLTNDTEYVGFVKNKNYSVPISMRYRKIGNPNRPTKIRNVKWAFISTKLIKNTDTNFPWESSHFTLKKFQEKVLNQEFKLNFIVSNLEKKVIYDIMQEIVSNKKQTMLTHSFQPEENFIFEHKINDTYNLNIVYHEEEDIQNYDVFNLDNIVVPFYIWPK